MRGEHFQRTSLGSRELLYALGRTLIRHTKRQVLGGEEVLTLPPKTEEEVPGERAWGGCECVWGGGGG